LILTNKTVQENTRNKYNSNKVYRRKVTSLYYYIRKVAARVA